MTGCTITWMRRVASELTPHYPRAWFIFARAYHVPRTLDRSDGRGTFTIPGIEPDPRGFPLTAMRRFLSANYRDNEQQDDLVLMFHPAGGFSWVRQSETPGQ